MTTPKKQTKAALLDEINSINQARQEKIVRDLLDYLDPTKEEDVRIAAHLLHISEEEAKRRFYLSPEKRAEMAQAAQKITKEELEEGLKKIRSESERRRKIAETILEIRERGITPQDMDLKLSTAKELLKAVRKYHSIDEAIVTFREETAKKSFKGIEPEMIPVIKIYGTPKDKAILIICGEYEAKREECEQLLTHEETLKVRDSVFKGTQEDVEEYRDTFFLYQALREVEWVLRYLIEDTEKSIGNLAFAISQYEEAKQIQDFFNKVSSLLPEERKPDLLLLMAEYNNNLRVAREDRDLSLSPDGDFQEKSLSSLWDKVKKEAEYYNSSLSTIKGGITALYDWVEEHGAKSVVPVVIRKLRRIRKPLSEPSPKIPLGYYKDYPSLMEEDGEKPTEEDMKTAVLNLYGNSDPDETGVFIVSKYLTLDYERRIEEWR